MLVAILALIRWPWLRADHAQHLFIAWGIQAAVWAAWAACGLPYGSVVGALVAGSVFYGREHRDHQVKACAALRCNLAALPWTQYLPWTWCRDGRWDLLVPTAGVALVAALALSWGPLAALWRFLRG